MLELIDVKESPNMTTKAFISTLLELSKVKITFAVSLTTITGYVLASGSFDAGLILPTLGIFLLACGSSALNHYQEKDQAQDET